MIKTALIGGFLIVFSSLIWTTTTAQDFTREDTLRGTLNENRTWWDVLYYDIEVNPDFESKTITGKTTITFSALGGKTMQIDLQKPMIVDQVEYKEIKLNFKQEGNITLVSFPHNIKSTEEAPSKITITYHGQPREAVRAPWDGGWIWTKDQKGRPWMTVACQELGASVWYPCKDHQSDEPQLGAALTILTNKDQVAVGNGRLIKKTTEGEKMSYRWEVTNPINNYNIVPYIGAYENFSEVYPGEKGNLDCNYWVLDYNLGKAKKQFKQVTEMLSCFEDWMGPYPFYEDGYKLVEAPHVGMEHQSAVAYGNGFANGYRGNDLSGTGWGMKWDFILVHESGHEWFGNSITTNDIADMWVHESFTNYSETLFTQCQHGKEAADAYLQGCRRNISNDRPIIGDYGVNQPGSGDMYYKGASMIHTIRTMMQDDDRFKKMIRGMSADFYHQTVTTGQIENYIIAKSGLGSSLQLVFDQYLRTTQIPVVSWRLQNEELTAVLVNCIPNLQMKIYMPVISDAGEWINLNSQKPVKVKTLLSVGEITSGWNRNIYVNYLNTPAE